jgi:CHASE3 domain sensor protein
MKWDIQHKIGIAFAAVAIVLIAVFLLLDRSRRTQVERRNWVQHTEDVLQQLASLLERMTEADAAGRGYLISGDRAYLEPCQSAVRKIEPALEALSRLVVDNPGALHRLSRLRQAVRDNLKSDEEVIEIRRQQGVAAATRAFQKS